VLPLCGRLALPRVTLRCSQLWWRPVWSRRRHHHRHPTTKRPTTPLPFRSPSRTHARPRPKSMGAWACPLASAPGQSSGGPLCLSSARTAHLPTRTCFGPSRRRQPALIPIVPSSAVGASCSALARDGRSTGELQSFASTGRRRTRARTRIGGRTWAARRRGASHKWTTSRICRSIRATGCATTHRWLACRASRSGRSAATSPLTAAAVARGCARSLARPAMGRPQTT
jgi:hypothetical protein